jgi:putative ABC transport system permease protein
VTVIMQTPAQDFRFAIRLWSRTPGFTFAVVLTLALGIGANTAIFTLVHALLLEPLPYREPDRLVVVAEETARRPGRPNSIAPFNLVRWLDRATSFESVAAFFDTRSNLTGAGAPRELTTASVTPNYFATLGIVPRLGRTFAAGEGAPGNDDVAIISDALWQSAFGGEAGIVGRRMQLNGRSIGIVGVVAAADGLFVRELSLAGRPAEVWVPFELGAAHREWSGRYMGAVARIRDDVALAEGREEMRGIAAALAREFPERDTGWTVRLTPVAEALTGEIRPALLMLSGAVALVLLIACANVANLLLARGAARQREISTRRALGATGARVVSQLLVESLVLAAAGGAAGLLLALWGLDALLAIRPLELAVLASVRLSYPVLAFTAVVSLLTAALAGLAPAFEAARAGALTSLGDSRQIGGGIRHRRMQEAFVVAEIALAVALLVGAGLMVRSLGKLRSVAPGFDASNVLTARVGLPASRYAEGVQRVRFFREAVERVSGLPGVESAGAISFLPFTGLGAATSFTIAGEAPPLPGQSPTADVRVADNGYFAAMRIPLIRGRLFADRELAEPGKVVVVNETLARDYFGGQDPIGQQLDISMGSPPVGPTEIIGIVGDVMHADLKTRPRATAYWPPPQLPYGAMTLAIRTASDPLALAAAVAREIQAIDPDQPVSEVRTMAQWLARSAAAARFNALLLSIFAGLALLLAAIGIYGVMSCAVSRRAPEIGLRLALGADTRDVVTMFVARASWLSAVGAIGGGLLAWALSGLLGTLLFQTSASDPLTIAAVTAALGGVALLASYIPARRAARVTPVEALRWQ